MKQIHFMISLFSMLFMCAYAYADDVVRCEGVVEYEGKQYNVAESDDTEAEAKVELVEEACDIVCRGLIIDDPCEDRCERNARLVQVHCVDRFAPVPVAAPAPESAPHAGCPHAAQHACPHAAAGQCPHAQQ